MGKVISNDELNDHVLKKFEFAAITTNTTKTSFDPETFNTDNLQEATPTPSKPIEESLPATSDVESLLQKIETLTNQNVTITMELETLQSNVDTQVKEQTEIAYQKGKEEGVQNTQETLQEHNDDLNIQLVKSITSLDEQLFKHKEFLESIETELVDAASIIAQKVIKQEISENSQEITLSLAKVFLEDLKEASTITLKVNPKDAHYIQEQFSAQKNIKIDADDAINKGGIIILSDIGNIDSDIDTRLQKALALIQREG